MNFSFDKDLLTEALNLVGFDFSDNLMSLEEDARNIIDRMAEHAPLNKREVNAGGREALFLEVSEHLSKKVVRLRTQTNIYFFKGYINTEDKQEVATFTYAFVDFISDIA